ncbi:MAG TPA: DUF2167 domain-containing protein [Blastocatellia bacterium]|nr:DUF2167 domain-containing protein [Blastocatellia bacterium]
MKITLLICLMIFSPLLVQAKDRNPKPTPSKESKEEKEAEKALADFEKQLKYQRGKIVLKDGLATLEVPETFRYLDPDQADKILVEAWGNPPGEKTLGMLFPSNVSPVREGGWGIVITYEEDGYVKDDEADSINYDDLLKQMKEGVAETNEERKKNHYKSIELIGWAAKPHYDKTSHKLYWAKEIKFGDRQEHTLNYNIRVLGRKGVLVLNAVASMRQLQPIEGSMNDVIKFVTFNEGNRYTDFNPRYDKIAAYGIGALIAGKVVAKAGLLKLLIGLLVAGKKFVVLGVIAVGAFLKKLLGRKSEPSTSAE